MPRPLRELFAERWLPNRRTGCWTWIGTRHGGGYGVIKRAGVQVRAHRIAYELYVGPIPAGLQIDHVKARGCVSRLCVNPAHLEAVTQQENLRRGQVWENGARIHRAKTHCPHGHAYDARNTGWKKTGARRCRACHARAARIYRAARGRR